MNIGIYYSDGSLIKGLTGYTELARNLDFTKTVLFFEHKKNKIIIGSKINVRKGRYGREERIIAVKEVESTVENIIEMMVDFVNDVKELTKKLGFVILDKKYNEIEKLSFESDLFIGEQEKRISNLILILIILENRQVKIKSSNPTLIIQLLNKAFEELKPVIHLTGFSFAISTVMFPSDIWITSQMEKPNIDLDFRKTFLENECEKLELYKAYSALRKSNKLSNKGSIEEVIESLYFENNLLNKSSLEKVLSTNNNEQLIALFFKDKTKFMELLSEIENPNDIGWAINSIGHMYEYNQNLWLEDYQFIKHLDKEIALKITSKSLSSIKVQGKKIFLELYDIIRLDNSVLILFFNSIDDQIDHVLVDIRLKLIEDLIRTFPEKSEYFGNHIIKNNLVKYIDEYPNIKNVIEKIESKSKEIEVQIPFENIKTPKVTTYNIIYFSVIIFLVIGLISILVFLFNVHNNEDINELVLTDTNGTLIFPSLLTNSTVENFTSGEVAFTPQPLVMKFNEWIYSSPGTGPGRELVAQFQIEHNTPYSVTLTGWATEAHWPLMPEEWAIARIEIDGVILDEMEVASGSGIDVPFGDVLLDAGKHTLRVTMTNDLNILWGGDRNLYVEQLDFS